MHKLPQHQKLGFCVRKPVMKTNIIIFLLLFHIFPIFAWEKEGVFEAAYLGEIQKLNHYIQDGTDLNKKDDDGDLPLTLAASYNQYEAVKLLLENYADINKKTGFGRTALMEADSLKVVELLLKSGANIDLKDEAGDNALLLAAAKCNLKKAEVLLKLSSDINETNILGQTPLIKAIVNDYCNENQKLNFVNVLLARKAEVGLKDKNNKTAYIISKERNYNNISKLLLEKGAQEDKYSLDPNSLIQALLDKEYDRAKMMINNGVELNFIRGNFSPLICSIENIEIMKLLLAKGADVNLKNKMNMTALTIAVMANNVNAVRLLLENNADVNVISTLNDQTPLMFAQQNKNQAIIKMLKEKGSDINAKDSNGNTALIMEIGIDPVNMDEVKYLVKNTNQINLFNNQGLSPLFKAIASDNIELVKFLLQNGADINQINKNGVNVLTVAKKMKNNPEMIKLLKDFGAKE
ncbi:TPA: hypothetical protein DCR49_00850 [Candidatus Delongbacteria bacterium]|nr:hypothetical protein [Candidatus Delongbacteria bacterium]